MARKATAILGRRTVLRYAALGVMGAAATGVLSACGKAIEPGSGKDGSGSGADGSVAGQAFNAFILGSWDVTFPEAPGKDPFTLSIEDGVWSSTGNGGGNQPRPQEGTWTFGGGVFVVDGWRYTLDDLDAEQGSASEVPETVGPEATPASVAWKYDGYDLQVSIQWEPEPGTLTMTSIGGLNEDALLIVAKRT